MVLGLTESQAAPECYVSVVEALQRPLKGELQNQGLEGKFAGVKFDHELISARNMATGRVGHDHGWPQYAAQRRWIDANDYWRERRIHSWSRPTNVSGGTHLS